MTQGDLLLARITPKKSRLRIRRGSNAVARTFADIQYWGFEGQGISLLDMAQKILTFSNVAEVLLFYGDLSLVSNVCSALSQRD